MANEVSVTINFTAVKGKTNAKTGQVAQNFDMSGNDMLLTTATVVSSGWNALSFGAISGTPSSVFLQNVDTANYIELATDNAGANKFMKIPYGKAVFFTPSSATIYAKANTADVPIWLGAAEA